MADGYLTFDTKMNTGGFQKGVGSLTSAFSKLGAVVGAALSVAGIVAFGKASVQAASQMEAKFKGLEFLMRANGRSMSQATSFIKQYTSDGLVPMTSAYEAYKNMVSRGYDQSQIEQMMNVMKDAAVYNRQGQFTMGEAIEKATMGLRMENSLLTDSVGIQKNVAKMWQEYAREIGTTAGNLTMAQKRQAEFNGFMREGGVFAGAAAEYANSYAGQMAQLSASFLNLKIAVGNAIIPFINALLPAINAAILWFTRLFNIIGQVMNLLFGTNVSMKDLEEGAGGAADAAGDLADGTEAAEQAAKGALASFDKINVLAQEAGNGGGGSPLLPVIDPGGPGDELPPDDSMTAGFEALRLKIEELKLAAADLFGPLITSVGNLMIALEPVKTFVATGLQSFYDNLLVPIGTWVIGTGLPTFVDTLTEMVTNLDLTGMNTALTNLWNAIAPFAINVGEGLLWFWETVVTPIITWVWNDLLPAFLDLLTAAVGALDAIIGDEGGGASQGIKLFWDNVLAPVLNFAETLIVGIIEDLTGALTAFGDWCSENEGTVSLMTTVILTFLAELWLYNTGKKVAEWIVTSLVPAFGKLATSLATLNVPLWLSAIGVAALVVGILALSLVWDKLTPAERTEAMLRGLAAALLAAAIAVAVFHTSWTVGIAAAAIVGGLALLASASYLSGMSIPDIFSQGMGSLSAMEGAINTDYSRSPLPALASGAVIPPNAPFAAILGDQRRGTNIEAPEGLIRQIVREETAGAGGQNITITFEGTMAEFVRQLKPHIERETSRVGSNLIAKAVRA
jgi:hypothetical protein